MITNLGFLESHWVCLEAWSPKAVIYIWITRFCQICGHCLPKCSLRNLQKQSCDDNISKNHRNNNLKQGEYTRWKTWMNCPKFMYPNHSTRLRWIKRASVQSSNWCWWEKTAKVFLDGWGYSNVHRGTANDLVLKANDCMASWTTQLRSELYSGYCFRLGFLVHILY